MSTSVLEDDNKQMIQLINKKRNLILTALSLVLLVGLVSGFLWMNKNGSALKTKAAESGKTQISTDIFNKLSRFSITSNSWTNYPSLPVNEDIVAMASSTSGYLVVASTNYLYKISGPTSSYVSISDASMAGVAGNIISISGINRVHKVLTNDGKVYTSNTSDNATGWSLEENGTNLGSGAVPKRIGTDTGTVVLLYSQNGNENQIAYSSYSNFNGNWTPATTLNLLAYNKLKWGDIVAIDYIDPDSEIYAVTTNGYFLRANILGTTAWEEFNKFTGTPLSMYVIAANNTTYVAYRDASGATYNTSFNRTISYAPITIYKKTPGCYVTLSEPFSGVGGDYYNTVFGTSCTTPDTLPVCGNNIREVGETCDDGNTTDGDDCPATCQTEVAPPSVPSAFLKDLGYTTAETLLFTPSPTKQNKQWSLFKGVGEVSIAGTGMWQKSAAEVLYIGSVPQVTVTKTGSHYVVAGDSTTATYSIRFHAEGTAGITYPATITDNINSVIPASENSKITVVSAISNLTSVDTVGTNPYCVGATMIGAVDNASVYPASRAVKFNIYAATPGCEYEVTVTLGFAADIVPNTTITDTANISVESFPASDTFTTLVVGAFTQETRGGDVYAKGDLNFGQFPPLQYGAKYVLGADGSVQKTSESGWTLGGYGIRSGTTNDFDPDACTVSGSACKVMKDNIDRLMKGANTTKLSGGSIASGNFDLNLSNIPEGGVFYKSGNLDIGGGEGLGSATFKGKGTIIVKDGDVHIKNDMIYYDTSSNSKDILGIIVKNGNVIIDPGVENVSAIFYIYSDKNIGTQKKGRFIVNSNGGEDKRFILTGAVIASGYSTGTTREGAFELDRNYIGVKSEIEQVINQAIADEKTTAEMEALVDEKLQSSELFLYDSRIIMMPPPGFGGKIVGGM